MILTENDILERVDEYTLYCHYLEFSPDLGKTYRSPLRSDDSNPSFGVFIPRKYSDRELMWKDGAMNWSGDIFELVKRLYDLRTKREAAALVCSDFKIGPHVPHNGKITYNTIIPKVPVKIDIKSRPFDTTDLATFLRFHITEPILTRHEAFALHHYWLTGDPNEQPTYPRKRGYAYRIWDRYQLYFPDEEKALKWRSNYDERHLPGFLQLRYQHPLLILTKAKKDIMMFDSFGYEAIASRGENVFVPAEYLTYLETRYKEILVWHDNDGKTNAELYPYRKVYVPQGMRAKDPTDFCKRYGPKETLSLIKTLTGYEPL